MDLIIREACLDDATALKKLTIELGYPVSEADTRVWLEALLISKTHAVFVAVHQKYDLCGWIVVEKRLSLETGYKAELAGLVVISQGRRQGIGRELVKTAEYWAVQNGLSRLMVRSNINREESHTFYKNLGFVLKKTAHNYEKLLDRLLK